MGGGVFAMTMDRTDEDRAERTWMGRRIPPEVQLDLCGRQVCAPGFTRYIECDEGCGFLIGVGDAIDSVSHNSCLARA